MHTAIKYINEVEKGEKMIPLEMKWEKVNVEQKPRVRVNGTVRVIGKDKPNGITISGDLCDKACWEEGTRVTLYKSGSLMKLAYDEVGLLTLKAASSNSVNTNTLKITGMAVADAIISTGHTREYTAWVDGNDVLFKPKEGE